jgi:nucleoside-triphosphate--adenylate kinase
MSSLSLAKSAALAIRAASVPGTRAIANSTSSGKALPFSLHGLRAGVDECSNGQMLRMLMFGKPGAGKGTLSSRLVKKYDILTISTGDLLRQHIAEGLVHVHHYLVACNAWLTYLQYPNWPRSRRDCSTRRTGP